MPIGDLLASINGGEPPPKRKADDGPPRSTPNKVPRTASSTSATASGTSRVQQPSRPLDRPHAVGRPTNGNGNGISTGGSRTTGLSSALKPTNDTHRVTKPTAPSRFTGTARPSQQSVRPAEKAADGPAAAPKAPPKKGSFAEILARGKAAQATMGHVGKIQHKKTEKGAIVKKENDIIGKGAGKLDPRGKALGASRIDPRAAMGQQARKPGPTTSGYAGTAKSSAARSAPQRSDTPINGQSARKPGSRPSDVKDRKAAAEPERPKKAATATTGYTGTARPRPGASSSSSSQKQQTQRGGALLNRQPVRRPPSASRGSSSRYDDYDEDLDDFIEYDDEEQEDGLGGRYTYDDASDSDMEAGMDELDLEERMAERIARREDIEEEKLEKSLKAAKEERKRKALDDLRAKRR